MNLLLRNRPTIAGVLLAYFSLLTLNNVVFRHAHRLANGQIITHAHPYWPTKNKPPDQPNPHTNGQLVLLDALSHAVFLPEGPAPALAEILLVEFSVVSLPSYQEHVVSAPLQSYCGRGPPATA